MGGQEKMADQLTLSQLSWVMTSVRVAFVFIFAVVQLCTAQYVVYDLKRQAVTEPEQMSSPINYPA